MDALGEAIRVIVDGITVDGTQMADEREALMWGFTNMLHSQVQRLDRAVDRIAPEMKDLEKAQDGSEVKAWELQTLTGRPGAEPRRPPRRLREDARPRRRRLPRRDRRHLAPAPPDRTRARPARSPPPRSTPATSVRARKDRETRAHLPEGTLVAITGGKTVADADAVWSTLDMAHAKYGDMVLLHGGGPGVEKIAASWADARGVNQIVCRPDWNAHGKAAPFRRNDELLNLLPKGVIAFPGSGITGNLVDKARTLGIMPVTQRCLSTTSRSLPRRDRVGALLQSLPPPARISPHGGRASLRDRLQEPVRRRQSFCALSPSAGLGERDRLPPPGRKLWVVLLSVSLRSQPATASRIAARNSHPHP